ncbi:hypothetical protein GGR50DRAFT_698709 [Xylaria sp. CBS 124048]|nr:hypothetical protein GGR50DRAFT_698709 [Xylaria sp. CBS 124048]
MACAMCKLPLQHHQSALRVLGELPLMTVISILQHQWSKDITRIIYAHAEYYHDQSMFDATIGQKKQLNALDEDLKRHRSKYIMHYLHAVVEVHRQDEVGATLVTMENETVIRLKLEKALVYKLPNDLDAIFRQAKPIEWKGTMAWDQVRKCQDEARASIEIVNHTFGRGYVQEVIDRRLIMVISIAVRLDDESNAVPKTPDPMWCWNQRTKKIEEFQSLTTLDLF